MNNNIRTGDVNSGNKIAIIDLEQDAFGIEQPATELIRQLFTKDPNRTKDIKIARNNTKISSDVMKIERYELKTIKKELKKVLPYKISEALKEARNVDEVIGRARKMLDEVSAGTGLSHIDEDWADDFVKSSERASDDRVRDILAKILAGKIRGNDGAKRRLLAFLSLTDKGELETFSKFFSMSSNIGLYHMGSILSPNSLGKYGLSTYEIMTLSDIGLINADITKSIHLDLDTTGSNMIFADRTIFFTPKEPKHIELGIFSLTETGKQLFEYSELTMGVKREEYFIDFVEYLKANGCDVWVEYHKSDD